MDKLTKEQRHRCMSAIKNKDTKPELLVRKFLFSRGFRYRLNHPRLPGHPDLVCANIGLLFLLTVVFGMDIKNVSILFFQKRMWSFGVLKSKGIENEMQKNSTNWHQWAGIVLPFGSAN